jgi:transcriptional regulator with XRE-family HTH domain|tara:strand:+ start:975 stop:1193 length:219 start_codon:yes stop_codon:yes gene_type:complete
MVFNIKQAIRVAGAVHNLTNAELSGAAQLRPQQLSFMKSGQSNPNIRTLSRISDALGIPLSEFIAYGESYGK